MFLKSSEINLLMKVADAFNVDKQHPGPRNGLKSQQVKPETQRDAQ